MPSHGYDRIDADTVLPEPGDVYVTARLVYLVVAVRPVESKVWHDRWRIELERIGPRDPWPREQLADRLADGARCHYVSRYERGETPSDAARAAGLPVRAG
jgi:ribosomal protein S18 acetylase RimI-like enzyme